MNGRERAASVIDPWCAFMGSLGENCGFTTYHQCRAPIAGIGGYCAASPWYTPYPPPPSGARPIGR
jgi:hypothetical protein